MTKSETFLYRQNMLNDLKHFLSFFPAHPLRQSDGLRNGQLLIMHLFSVYHNPARSIIQTHDKLTKLFTISGCTLNGLWTTGMEPKFLYPN